jgi:signal transduction histidine kinase
MRLAEFILQNVEPIVEKWESFAALQLPAAANMDELALRDHAEQILGAIAKDLETHQTREEQVTKSLGQKPAITGAPETAAQTHATLRAIGGFDINQLASEYRALRASVLRLWTDAHPAADAQLEQIMRFNEAIDEALAESIGFFHTQVEKARNLLLGVLGHDLRSPLQSIQMTAAYLTHLNAGSEISAAAARLISSGARMHALLDDLRDYNRVRFGMGIQIRPAPIDAALAITDELNLLRAAYPTRQIELEVSGDTHGVWDGMRLRQVVNNLVENAIKYGDDNTAIQVAVKGYGAHLLCQVKNRGAAIEPSELQYIFDPLRRNLARRAETEIASGNGLGLGLYIVREIVEGHGGDITAQSDQSQTVFTVRLPQRLASETLRREPHPSSAQSPTNPIAAALSRAT